LHVLACPLTFRTIARPLYRIWRPE